MHQAAPVLNCTPRQVASCSVCSSGPGTFAHPRMGRICGPCARAAGDLVSGYDAAAARQREEFLAQLRDMVIARRSGAEEPQFYRAEIA